MLWKREQNNFNHQKVHSKKNLLGYFCSILKIKGCQKGLAKIITARKTVKLWILTSSATLKRIKWKGNEKNCCKHIKKTIEVILEWFSTTRMAATSPRISIFTLSLPKVRAFSWMVPMFASPILKDDKRY